MNQFQNQRKDNNNYPRVTRFIGGGDEEYIPTQKELDEAQEEEKPLEKKVGKSSSSKKTEEKKSGFGYFMRYLFQKGKN